MDFTSIKDILEKEKSKVIIFESGKPSYVLLPIEEYRALVAVKPSQEPQFPTESLTEEHLNEELQENSTSFGVQDTALSFNREGAEERARTHTIKLEDLPF